MSGSCTVRHERGYDVTMDEIGSARRYFSCSALNGRLYVHVLNAQAIYRTPDQLREVLKRRTR
jgi:hypothetical protein